MKLVLTIIVFLFSFHVVSQEKVSVNYNDISLSDVFIDLENRFNVKFSFNSDLVINQFVTFQSEDVTLEDILIAIETQINIKFRKESDRYYTVKRLPKTDLTSTQLLQEIVINEYITSGINKVSDDASISVSPKELGILPGLTEPDVLQSIQLLPGVQSPTETASGVYIRGGTPDQNLVLWDGIKMYHSGHFFGTISAFNPYITEDIRLYKNGTRAKYGNRISGVIDISSDNKLPQKLQGGLGFNMTHMDAFVKAPISESTAIIVSARRSINDIYNSETFKNLSKRVFQDTKISEGNKVFEDDQVTTTKDLFYFTDFTVKAIVKPNENNEITVSTLFTKNKLDYGFLIEEYDEASQDKLDISNHGTSLKWKHIYNPKLSHAVSGYFSSFDLGYVGSNSITDEFNDELAKENGIDDLGVSYDLNWAVKEKSSIGFGYQFSSSRVKYLLSFEDSESPEDNFSETNIDTNNNHAIYADYQYKVKDKWFFNLGLRSSYFSVLDRFFIEPRFQLETKLNSNFKFKASAERLHQAVSQVVEFNTKDFGLENQIWALSDGNLIPVLKSTQLTTGFVFNKDGWNIDIEGFYKNIKGLTSFTLGFNNEDDFFSKGKSTVLGLELLVKKRIENYRTWLSYALIDNDFKFSNINNGEAFPGNADITHQVTWSHTYEWQNFNVSLGWNWRTGIPYTMATGIMDTPDGSVIVFDDTNGARLPDYHRLDISTTYKFNISNNERWKGKLGLSILNLYNQKNILSRTYEKRQSTMDNGEVLREINKISLGITPNLVFRVEF
ncbi:TonB-dependent receptor domain-containing protein [Geojedonia litorea]|uniref:TonB-dependent receptor domain-containing protein n=1 Tax=Geojedonia litorea TaxID=1268269 RepID=A0ABV9N6C0_9FLAO